MRVTERIKRAIMILIAALVFFCFVQTTPIHAATVSPALLDADIFIGPMEFEAQHESIEPMAAGALVKVAELAPEAIRLIISMIAGTGIAFTDYSAMMQTVGNLQISECLAVEINGTPVFLCACCSSRNVANVSQDVLNQVGTQVGPQLAPMVQGNQLVTNPFPDVVSSIQVDVNLPVINTTGMRWHSYRALSSNPVNMTVFEQTAAQFRGALPNTVSILGSNYTFRLGAIHSTAPPVYGYRDGMQFIRTTSWSGSNATAIGSERLSNGILGLFLNMSGTAIYLMLEEVSYTNTDRNVVEGRRFRSIRVVPSLSLNMNAVTSPNVTVGTLQQANAINDIIAAMNAAIAAAGVTGTQDITISVPANPADLVGATPQEVIINVNAPPIELDGIFAAIAAAQNVVTGQINAQTTVLQDAITAARNLLYTAQNVAIQAQTTTITDAITAARVLLEAAIAAGTASTAGTIEAVQTVIEAGNAALDGRLTDIEREVGAIPGQVTGAIEAVQTVIEAGTADTATAIAEAQAALEAAIAAGTAYLTGTIAGTIAGTIPDGFFPPGDIPLPDFDLPDPGIFDFTINLMDYFPFSIPRDIMDLIMVLGGHHGLSMLGATTQERNLFLQYQETGILSAEEFALIEPMIVPMSAAPRIEVNIPLPNFSGGTIDADNVTMVEALVLDLGDYPTFVAIIRFGVFLIFLFGLMKLTPKFLTW